MKKSNVKKLILAVSIFTVFAIGSYVTFFVQERAHAQACSTSSCVFQVTPGSISKTLLAGSSTSTTVQLFNLRGSNINWTVVASSSVPWLTFAPSSGVMPANGPSTFNVTLNSSGLAAGSYSTTLHIDTGSSGAFNSYDLPVNLTVANTINTTASLGSGTITYPSGIAMNAGTSGIFQIQVNDSSGSLGTKLFGTSGLPSGVTASFSPNTMAFGGFTQMTLTVPSVAGSFSFTFRVQTGNSGTFTYPISLNVIAAATKPHILVSPATLSFNTTHGSSPANQSFSVTNNGQTGSTLNWSAAKVSGSSWLSFAPTSGSLAQGATPQSVTVSVNSTALATGSFTDKIRVSDANATNTPQDATINLTVAPPPASFNLSCTSNCDFAGIANTATSSRQTLSISNTGASTLNWTVSKTNNWLTLSQLSGTTSPGGVSTILASVDFSNLSSGNASDTITVSDGNGGLKTTLVSVAVGDPLTITQSVWKVFNKSDLTTPLSAKTDVGKTNYTASGLSAGSYQASLDITNNVGQSANAAKDFSVTGGVISVSLSAAPSSGSAPLSTTLTAVAGGTQANATVNYNFWWNCTSIASDYSGTVTTCGALLAPASGTCLETPGVGYKCDGMSTPTQSAPSSGGHVYNVAGAYTPKVVIESGSAASATDSTTVNVSATASHAECDVDSSCIIVVGPGTNACTTSPCNGCVGPGCTTHAVCNSVNHTCTQVIGPGTNTCTNNLDCAPPCTGDACPPPAPSCSSFSALPGTITVPQSSNLSWACSDATSCSINNGVGSVSTSTGVKSVSPTVTTTYTLTCNSPGGSTTPTTTVRVIPLPPSCTFSASPTTITPPGSATLSWNCSNADTCTISRMGVPTHGTKIVSPTLTTIYSLSCSGPGGTNTPSAHATVSVTGTGIIETNP